jgi:hypothetical protein
MNRLALTLALILSGCGSPPELDRSYLSGAEQATGVVIFSITRTGPHQAPGAKVEFRCEAGARGDAADHHMRTHYIDGPALPIPVPPDFRLGPERPGGRLHMLELPAGPCEFHTWSAMSVGQYGEVGSGSSKLSIRFEVPANRTAYIGSLNAEWSGARSYRLTFTDQYERDLAALRKQNVALPADVRKQLGTPGPNPGKS